VYADTIDAVSDRRNEKWRAKQEIALKAQKSACRNQSLDVLCKPRPGTAVFAGVVSSAPLERQRPSTASDRTARTGTLWGDKGINAQQPQPLLRGFSLQGESARAGGAEGGLLSQYAFGGGAPTAARSTEAEDDGRLIIATPDLPAIPSPRHALTAWNPVGLIEQMNLFLKDDTQAGNLFPLNTLLSISSFS
jgi:hypothetical protein